MQKIQTNHRIKKLLRKLTTKQQIKITPNAENILLMCKRNVCLFIVQIIEISPYPLPDKDEILNMA